MYKFKMEVASLPDPEDENLKKIVAKSLEQIEFKDKLHPKLYEILAEIEKYSKFNEDSRKIAVGTDNVLGYLEQNYSKNYPHLNFTKQQKQESKLAAILHDIGKAGPADASEEQREAVIRLYASEHIRNPNISVEKAVASSFTNEEIDEILFSLSKCGVNPNMTMRQFWDLHAGWTHDLLEKHPDGLNRRTRVIAASHHFDHGINPYMLPETEVPIESKTIGLMEEYTSATQRQILSAVDQYEARVRRGNATHDQAIAWVRQNLDSQIAKDENLKLICDAIDELGKQEKIFTNGDEQSS